MVAVFIGLGINILPYEVKCTKITALKFEARTLSLKFRVSDTGLQAL